MRVCTSLGVRDLHAGLNVTLNDTDGVANNCNFRNTPNVVFTVPASGPSELKYRCKFHRFMSANINVVDEPVCTITAGTQTPDAFVVHTEGCFGKLNLAHVNSTTPGGMLNAATATALADGTESAANGDHSFAILRAAPALMQHGSYYVINTNGGISKTYGPFNSRALLSAGGRAPARLLSSSVCVARVARVRCRLPRPAR